MWYLIGRQDRVFLWLELIYLVSKIYYYYRDENEFSSLQVCDRLLFVMIVLFWCEYKFELFGGWFFVRFKYT